MKFNEDAQIGEVLFIVEGGKTEFEILKRIFCGILKYDYIEKRRSKPWRFINLENTNNRVYVVNTRESNISFISDETYLDELYEYLINNYDLNFDNLKIFYLFDRDSESNNDDITRQYIQELRNPLENDDEKGGLLLLSYPSIESFVVSNFKEESYRIEKKLGADVKTYLGLEDNVRIMQYNHFTKETIQFACIQFQNYVQENGFELDIDSISLLSSNIFESEEAYYNTYDKYHLISMLTIAFLELGILEPEEGDYFYPLSSL